MKKKENRFKSIEKKSNKNKTSRIKTKKDINNLRNRLKKIQLIEKEAGKRFEKLISDNFPEINTRKRYIYDVNKKRKLLKPDEDYLSVKDMFIWEIQNHFKNNKIISDSKFKILPLLGELKKANVANDLDELTDEIIDEVITGYIDVVNLVLSLIPSLSPLAKAKIVLLKKKYETKIYNMEMQNRTYDILLFRRAKEIYIDNNNKRPKITQSEALYKANNELKIYEQPLRDNDGYDTPFFVSMQGAFRKEHQNL